MMFWIIFIGFLALLALIIAFTGEMRWKGTARAGFYGSALGSLPPRFYKFRWQAELRGYLWTTLTFFQGRLEYDIEWIGKGPEPKSGVTKYWESGKGPS